ncbi:helix-turn-helix domain-containing protein [Streptomyces sp. NPDC059533]|uniref:helix-turn-helix domain-containing protein n=1 Tax=unclassified Streptomyces TaxID=2593676 RepID=UPI00368649BE
MYQEAPSRAVSGAVLWRAGGGGVVLPDGCMDLLWVEGRLLVAGPDTGPHPAGEVSGRAFAGIRFAPGAAPALLGVPAHVLRDRCVDLADLWPRPEVRRLTGLVAGYGDPRAGLEAVAAARAAGAGAPDGFAAEVTARLRAGETVAGIAAALGVGERRLHRRSLDVFGYGPRALGRILRLRHALAPARSGTACAEVAHTAGYADRAHLAGEVRAPAGTTQSAYAGPAGAKSETPQPSGSRTTA